MEERASLVGQDRLERICQLLGRTDVAFVVPLGHRWAPVTRVVFGDGDRVVVKTRRTDGEGHGGPAYIRRERAALRLLDGAGIAPILLAEDDDRGIVVISDVGSGPTLESVLLGLDETAATAAFTALGRTLGVVHAVSYGRQEEHFSLRSGDGPPFVSDWRDAVDDWPAFERMVTSFELPDPRPARSEVRWLHERLDDPGYRALVHFDCNPTNVMVTGDTAVLVDFEGADFRHVGIDLSELAFPFPCYSAHWATVPAGVSDAAIVAYRDAASQHIPWAAVDDDVDEVLAVGCAVNLLRRSMRLPRIAKDDDESWRRRTQLLQQMDVFVQRAERADILPILSGWVKELGGAMRARWRNAGDPPPRPFPAFDPEAEPRARHRECQNFGVTGLA